MTSGVRAGHSEQASAMVAPNARVRYALVAGRCAARERESVRLTPAGLIMKRFSASRLVETIEKVALVVIGVAVGVRLMSVEGSALLGLLAVLAYSGWTVTSRSRRRRV